MTLLYDGLNLSGFQDLVFQESSSTIRLTQTLNFTTPKMVKGDVKVIIFKNTIPPGPVGTIFCRVWKNTTGGNIEVVETSLTTVDAGSLPTTPTIFTFPFLGTGGFFTNSNIAVGLEYIGSNGNRVTVRATNTSQVPDTNFKFFKLGAWENFTIADMYAEINGSLEQTKTLISDIILVNPRTKILLSDIFVKSSNIIKTISSDVSIINPRIIQKTVQIRKGLRSNAQIQ